MKKTGLVLAAFAAGFISVGANAEEGTAASWGPGSINEYSATYYVRANGTIDITIDFVVDIEEPNPFGFSFVHPRRKSYDHDHDQILQISNIEAWSPTGAPADVELQVSDDLVAVALDHDFDSTTTGVHEYEVRYTVAGMALDGENVSGEVDVLPLSVVSPFFGSQVDNVVIVVKGDADVLHASCFQYADGADGACTSATVTDGVANITQDRLERYGELALYVDFLAGEVESAPILVPKGAVLTDSPTGSATAPPAASAEETSADSASETGVVVGTLAGTAVLILTLFIVRAMRRKVRESDESAQYSTLAAAHESSTVHGDGLLH